MKLMVSPVGKSINEKQKGSAKAAQKYHITHNRTHLWYYIYCAKFGSTTTLAHGHNQS